LTVFFCLGCGQESLKIGWSWLSVVGLGEEKPNSWMTEEFLTQVWKNNLCTCGGLQCAIWFEVVNALPNSATSTDILALVASFLFHGTLVQRSQLKVCPD
jgi:hypothetical protein